LALEREQIIAHLSAQEAELLKQTQMLPKLVEA
jgi:hypothetical protein